MNGALHGASLLVAVAGAFALGGCASVFYAKTPTGAFSGRLDVEWIAPNQFIYRPHPDAPLTYRASDGRSIRPRIMYTDGGSIPRLFWSANGLGPWDFAPGYIIHDWLFVQHFCKEGDWREVDFPHSAGILAEAIKSQMEKAGQPDATLLWAIHEAVSSSIARIRWDTGDCKAPPTEPKPLPSSAPAAPAPKPVKILTISF